MKRIITKSGISGWQDRLQNIYSDFEEFECYSRVYNLANRLGYKSIKRCWNHNPLIEGSINPLDFRRSKNAEK